MNRLHWIALLSLALASGTGCTTAIAQADGQATSAATTTAAGIPSDRENERKAREVIDQAIEALGGQAYLNIHDIEQEGRIYSFHHGRPTSNGVLFWRFVEYPNKERIEITKERDIAYVYAGEKGYEITYKGPHPVEKKDLEDYLRRRRLSLDALLRDWYHDPSVALFYDGGALAGNQQAVKVTLINAKNEAVSLFFDPESHLPLMKSYIWRDPVDRFQNKEEEIYDNYRPVQGVMTAWGFTRYFNGDMQSQRFASAVHINQGLDQAMFDPNSGYNPIKAEEKNSKKKKKDK